MQDFRHFLMFKRKRNKTENRLSELRYAKINFIEK